jgi:3-oxoacyl-[acyl-carrier-protein] synthase-3
METPCNPAAVIRGIRSYLPARVLTNDELAGQIGWSAADIERKTGIVARHIAAEDECVSDMAVAATKRLLADLRIDPAGVQFLILCTQTPDHHLPTTACLVQPRAGLPTTCAAFDLNQGCSAYLYALAVAAGFLQSGLYEQGIVVTADTYTKLIHPKDRSVRTLFGDAATAAWITRGDEPGLGRFLLGTDGTGAPNLIVPAGGMRQRPTAETAREYPDAGGNTRTRNHLYMNGPAIFEFTLQRVPELTRRVLELNGLGLERPPDWYVFHQANVFILEHLRRRMEIPAEKMLYHLRDVGNTVSSTIPLALEEHERRGQFASGQRLLLLGFGVGYSWGGTVLTWR